MKVVRLSVLALVVVLLAADVLRAQGGVHTLFGDFHVDESKAEKGPKPLLYELVLCHLGGAVVSRQFVNSNGRYRFLNIANGQYHLVIMLETEEIGRTRVEILAPIKNDFRQDIALEWKGSSRPRSRPGSISAADFYSRPPQNQKLFDKAREATNGKRYDESLAALQQLLALDSRDFQAWSELGTVYLFKQDFERSEKAYLRSAAERPTFFLAFMNLGRLRVSRRDFAGAVDPLNRAVALQPTSAEANYYLAEAYLQIKKGSRAVSYFYEALKLDPIGRAEAHLRVALLYEAAGLREKAAAECAAFLKKRPDYENRRQLERYIALHKATPETKRH